MRWNFWSSPSDAPAGGSAAPTASTAPAVSTASPTHSPSTPPTSSSAPAAAEPSGLLSRFERTLKDEEAYQEMQFPTFEEVPGCMRLFDEFLMCYALMPQLRNVYRYGELRDCTYKFDDFKYCMSLKGEDVEERRRLWVRRRAEWWAARRVGPSSEDVWEARDKPLENFPPLYNEDGSPVTETEAMPSAQGSA